MHGDGALLVLFGVYSVYRRYGRFGVIDGGCLHPKRLLRLWPCGYGLLSENVFWPYRVLGSVLCPLLVGIGAFPSFHCE